VEAQLKEVPFFGMLSKKESAAVARQTDEIYVSEGDVGREFFVISDGTAEVVRGDDRIAELGPGDLFGELRSSATTAAWRP
jgi:CRP-like cAMP-binding protein